MKVRGNENRPSPKQGRVSEALRLTFMIGSRIIFSNIYRFFSKIVISICECVISGGIIVMWLGILPFSETWTVFTAARLRSLRRLVGSPKSVSVFGPEQSPF
jgi:hypothetical protein